MLRLQPLARGGSYPNGHHPPAPVRTCSAAPWAPGSSTRALTSHGRGRQLPLSPRLLAAPLHHHHHPPRPYLDPSTSEALAQSPLPCCPAWPRAVLLPHVALKAFHTHKTVATSVHGVIPAHSVTSTPYNHYHHVLRCARRT